MDESERQRRSPSWGARPPKPAPVSKRIVVPIWQEPAEPTTWLLNLILVVLLCVVVMAVATAGLRGWVSTHGDAAGTATDPAAGPMPSPERATARSLIEATEELERQARLKLQREADERLQAATKQRLAEEEAARRTAASEARREREWQASYKRPDICNEHLPEADSVGCANDFIRQRRTFDEQWAARNRGN